MTRIRSWARRHAAGIVLAAAIVYAAGIVGAFMFASAAVQREADERIAAADRRDAELAVDLARTACRSRNEIRAALAAVFIRLDELIAERGGGEIDLTDLFADLLERENCAAINDGS